MNIIINKLHLIRYNLTSHNYSMKINKLMKTNELTKLVLFLNKFSSSFSISFKTYIIILTSNNPIIIYLYISLYLQIKNKRELDRGPNPTFQPN